MVRTLSVVGALILAISVAAAPLRASETYKMQVNPLDYQTLTPSDPAGAIKSARELIAAGQMNDAIRHLQTYVLQHPYEISPRRFLGDLYVRVGQLDRAESEYQAILRFAPGDKETHNRLGTVYAVRDQVNDAIAQFSAALPGTDSVNDLVALHQRRGDLQSYKNEMDRIAAEYPVDPAIQGEMGQIYNALNQPYLASVYFKRALDSDPQDLTSLNGLGLAYMNLHDYPNSISEFKSCIAVDSVAYQCENNLGAAELESGNYVAAKTALDRAYQLAPERGETFVNYGYLADANNDWHSAVTDYARAIAIWPYIKEAYIDLGIAYEDHKLYALAQEALVKGLASVPDDGRLHFLLGRAYEMQGDKADALTQFKLAASGSDPTAVRIGQEHFAALSAGSDTNPQ
jgi:tetratricopeptide (TPR) repeat protein